MLVLWKRIPSSKSIQMKIGAKEGTLTGTIEFDRFGNRKNFDVSIVDLVSNTKATFNRKEVVKLSRENDQWVEFQVLAWRQGVGFFTNRTVAQHSRKILHEFKEERVIVLTNLVGSVGRVCIFPTLLLGRPIRNDKKGVSGNVKFDGMRRK